MLATFHLHYLGYRVKYENPEVGNTTQPFFSTTRPCRSVKFIESFLFWVILVTYNIGIYIFIYIFIKLAIFILFSLSSTVMFFLHCMVNMFRYEKMFCEIVKSIPLQHNPSSDVIFLGVLSESIFPVMQYFVSKESCVSLKNCVLWSPCLLLITELISLDISGKPTVEFFLKMIYPSWIILSISLNELNSVDWLMKSWWLIFLKLFLFYCCKRNGKKSWYGKKYGRFFG